MKQKWKKHLALLLSLILCLSLLPAAAFADDGLLQPEEIDPDEILPEPVEPEPEELIPEDPDLPSMGGGEELRPVMPAPVAQEIRAYYEWIMANGDPLASSRSGYFVEAMLCATGVMEWSGWLDFGHEPKEIAKHLQTGTTTAGYNVLYYDKASGSLWDILENLSDTYSGMDLLLTFNESPLGEQGHSVYINGIYDGLVCFCAGRDLCINGVDYPAGTPIGLTIPEFVGYYGSLDWLNMLRFVYVSPTVNTNVKSFNFNLNYYSQDTLYFNYEGVNAPLNAAVKVFADPDPDTGLDILKISPLSNDSSTYKYRELVKALRPGKTNIHIQIKHEGIYAETSIPVEVTDEQYSIDFSPAYVNIDMDVNPTQTVTAVFSDNFPEGFNYQLQEYYDGFDVSASPIYTNAQGHMAIDIKVIGFKDCSNVSFDVVCSYADTNTRFLSAGCSVKVKGSREGVALSSSNFPDENFLQLLYTFDYDDDRFLDKQEIEGVTVIYAPGRDIENMQGIWHFTNLRSLTVGNNKIAYLNLSKNTKLKSLEASSNVLSSLSLQGLTELESLNLNNNNLVGLNTTPCTSLTDFTCTGNTFKTEKSAIHSCYFEGFDINKIKSLNDLERFEDELYYVGSSTSGSYEYDVGGGKTVLFGLYRDKPAEIKINYIAPGAESVPAAQTAYEGNLVCLSEEVPVKTGRKFEGWSLYENGGISYQPADYYTGGHSINLYAVFSEAQAMWLQDNRGWQYLNADGTLSRDCWQQIDGYTYNFDADGYVRTGFYSEGDSIYFFDESGHLVYDWYELDGKWYYFDENGRAATGWLELWGDYYFFDEAGVMAVGEKTVNGSDYYFYDNGHMVCDEWMYGYYYDVSGAKQIPGLYGEVPYLWYKNADGSSADSEFKDVDGNTYYFQPGGYAATGWYELDGQWYYFSEEGSVMQRGWVLMNGHYYYFDEAGVMAVGEREINGSYYYFYDDGVMATDVEINGHLYSPGGNMYTNCWMGESPYWWYQLSDGSFYHDCFKTIDGSRYYFQSNGYVYFADWLEMDGYTYYFDYDGRMYRDGSYEIDGQSYTFDKQGHLI